MKEKIIHLWWEEELLKITISNNNEKEKWIFEWKTQEILYIELIKKRRINKETKFYKNIIFNLLENNEINQNTLKEIEINISGLLKTYFYINGFEFWNKLKEKLINLELNINHFFKIFFEFLNEWDFNTIPILKENWKIVVYLENEKLMFKFIYNEENLILEKPIKSKINIKQDLKYKIELLEKEIENNNKIKYFFLRLIDDLKNNKDKIFIELFNQNFYNAIDFLEKNELYFKNQDKLNFEKIENNNQILYVKKLIQEWKIPWDNFYIDDFKNFIKFINFIYKNESSNLYNFEKINWISNENFNSYLKYLDNILSFYNSLKVAIWLFIKTKNIKIFSKKEEIEKQLKLFQKNKEEPLEWKIIYDETFTFEKKITKLEILEKNFITIFDLLKNNPEEKIIKILYNNKLQSEYEDIYNFILKNEKNISKLNSKNNITTWKDLVDFVKNISIDNFNRTFLDIKKDLKLNIQNLFELRIILWFYLENLKNLNI